METSLVCAGSASRHFEDGSLWQNRFHHTKSYLRRYHRRDRNPRTAPAISLTFAVVGQSRRHFRMAAANVAVARKSVLLSRNDPSSVTSIEVAAFLRECCKGKGRARWRCRSTRNFTAIFSGRRSAEFLLVGILP